MDNFNVNVVNKDSYQVSKPVDLNKGILSKISDLRRKGILSQKEVEENMIRAWKGDIAVYGEKIIEDPLRCVTCIYHNKDKSEKYGELVCNLTNTKTKNGECNKRSVVRPEDDNFGTTALVFVSILFAMFVAGVVGIIKLGAW